MKDPNTPLIRQYLEIKNKYPEHILLYRIGDFYETFFEDAEKTARACNIILTKRNNGAAGDVPLAGFPYHQLENYLPKLVSAGYRVAICEQVEDPKKAKGIVRREVIEVVTPGIILNERLLTDKSNNFLCSIFLSPGPDRLQLYGISFCDVSTGEFFIGEIPTRKIREFLETYPIKEIIISKEQKQHFENLINSLPRKNIVNKLEPWIFDHTFAREALLGHFGTTSLKGFGVENLHYGIISSGALLYYIKETQQAYLNQIRRVKYYNPNEFMLLDLSTRRNLEIYSSLSNDQAGGLFAVLDQTLTPMGARLLRNWINQPLINSEKINQRLNAVDFFYQNDSIREALKTELSKIADIERIASRICSFKANPRDVLALKSSLDVIPTLKTILSSSQKDFLKEKISSLDTFDPIRKLISNSIREDASVNVGSGNTIKLGFNQQFDNLLNLSHNGRKLIQKYQEEERKKTNIPSLKISYNNVFGYYIEVTKAHSNKVPNYYERKQTLTNAERYTTPELRELEFKLLNLESEIQALEVELYNQILSEISKYIEQIQTAANIIAELDCLLNFAAIAKRYNYCKPIVTDGFELEIINGRHPVVERNLPIGEKFTPNSTKMDQNSVIHIITGPNMSGKSCYLRQVGLIVLLAQIGSFVPADSAKIGIVDRIFTRVGAQDNIFQGESTFLVEMQESANILNNATRKSLILLDEVGRGTATFDGISIAWAIVEYIHNHIGSKTLFATHYHELNELEKKYENIVNYYIEVLEKDNKVIFTHKLKPGHSDHSFGIYVAEMAGIPNEVTTRAKEILKILESGITSQDEIISVAKPNPKKIKAIGKEIQTRQLAIFDFSDSKLKEKILELDLNNLTPIQALMFLEELQKELKNEN